jgi:hypothetical protein
MTAQVFSPDSLSGASYSGGVGSIDEGLPPAGGGAGEQIQTTNIAAAGTATGEVGFDCSSSLGFGPVQVRMHHTGTQSGGWRVAAQLKVDGVNVGSEITVDRVGNAGAMRTSVFNWPLDELAAISAAMAADPDLVSLSWVATNLHASAQSHRIDTIALLISASEIEPDVPEFSFPWSKVLAAYDLVVGGDHLDTPDESVRMLPDLKGRSHLGAANGTAPTYVDDMGVPKAIDFTNGRFATTLDIAAPGYTDFDLVALVRTPVTLPTSDSDSMVNVAGWSGAGIGNDASYNIVTVAIAAGPSGGIGWLVMCGPVGAENDHLRDDLDPDADSWYIIVVRVRSAANELLYAHLADGAPIESGDLRTDAQGASGTCTLLSFGVGSRMDFTRPWTGWGSAWWFFDGTMTESELLTAASEIAGIHGLVDTEPQDGAETSVSVAATAGGSPGFSGGAGASVQVGVTAGGHPNFDFSDGAVATVEVGATAGGQQSGPPADGSVANVIVTATAGGIANHQRGAATSVSVTATGGGIADIPSELVPYSGPYVVSAVVVDDSAEVSAGG